jgi:hypothetical protein
MAGWFAAALLTRETMLSCSWGLATSLRDRWRSQLVVAAWLAVAVVPFAAWLLYVYSRWGSGGAGWGAFSFPLSGLGERWCDSVRLLTSCHDRALSVSTLLATVAVTAQLAFVLWHRDLGNRWWRLAAGQAALLLLLGRAVWEGEPGAYCRVLLPLLVACNVLVLSRRHAWPWLLAINLSVGAGLVTMRPITGSVELAVAQHTSATVTLRGGEGCYGVERTTWHRRFWIKPQAEIEAWVWNASPGATATLVAEVRAVDERLLVITADGQEVWRGNAEKKWKEIRVPDIHLPKKQGKILLSSPGAPSSVAGDSRALAVCFRDLKIEISVGRVESDGQTRRSHDERNRQ